MGIFTGCMTSCLIGRREFTHNRSLAASATVMLWFGMAIETLESRICILRYLCRRWGIPGAIHSLLGCLV